MKAEEIKVGVRVRTNSGLTATIMHVDEIGDPHLEFDDVEIAEQKYAISSSGYYAFGRSEWKRWEVIGQDKPKKKKDKLKKKIKRYTKMRKVFAREAEMHPNTPAYICIDLAGICADTFNDRQVYKFVRDLDKFGRKHVPGFYRDAEDAFAYEGIDKVHEIDRYNKTKLQHIDMYLAYLRLQRLLRN